MSRRLWTPTVRKDMHLGNDIFVCQSTETSKCDCCCLCLVLGWLRYRFWRRRLCILDSSWFCIFLPLNGCIVLWLTPQLHSSTPFLINFSQPFSPSSLGIEPPGTWSRPLFHLLTRLYMSGVLHPVLLRSSCSARRLLVLKLYYITRTCRSDAVYKSVPTEPVTDKTLLYTHRDGSLKMFPESLYFWEIQESKII